MNGRLRRLPIVGAILALFVGLVFGLLSAAPASAASTVKISGKVSYVDTKTKTTVTIKNTGNRTATFRLRDAHASASGVGHTHTVKKVTLKPGKSATVTLKKRNYQPMWVTVTYKGKTKQVGNARVSKYDSAYGRPMFFVAAGCEKVTVINLWGETVGVSWYIDYPDDQLSGGFTRNHGKIKQITVKADGVFSYEVSAQGEIFKQGESKPFDC